MSLSRLEVFELIYNKHKDFFILSEGGDLALCGLAELLALPRVASALGHFSWATHTIVMDTVLHPEDKLVLWGTVVPRVIEYERMHPTPAGAFPGELW